MNMMETMIGIALAAVMVATMLEWSDDHTQEGEAQLVAATLDELNAGAKHYMQSEFETLAECMALATHVNKWADDFEADHPGVGGMTYGREASPWYAIPLYDNDAGLTDPNWRAARSECGDEPWVVTGALLGWPPSLFETGFLPAGLQGLRHTANADDEAWGTRGLRLRLYLRWVNASRRDASVGSPARPVLESMLVAGTDRGTRLSRNLVQRVMRASTTADVGAVTSQGVGTAVVAHTQVYGVNGGWQRELCLAQSASVTQGSIARCPVPSVVLAHEPDLEADFIPLDFENGGVGRVANRGEPFLAARVALPGSTELSGKGTADTVETGRLVYMGMMRPESKLADMLYRRDVGVPELNRMETDLNFGGYGGLNAAFFAGIDIDGDGVPDEGLHIVGPPNDTADRRNRPTVVHGDLTVLGNLQVGGEEPAFGDDKAKFDLAGTNVWTTGNVHAFGSMHLGPGEFEATELRRGRTNNQMTAGHLLVTGSAQVGGTEFDKPTGAAPQRIGAGMATHPGSLLIASNAQVGLVNTGGALGPATMDDELVSTGRWVESTPAGAGTWKVPSSWTVAASTSAQGVVWSRHVVVASANATPFVSFDAKEGRVIAEQGVRIGAYPATWTEDDDIDATLGGLEVRAGTEGRDALLAARHRPAATGTPPIPARSEIISTIVPGQTGRQGLEMIAERATRTPFETARILLAASGDTEVEGLNVRAKASDAMELHAATPAGGTGTSTIIADATKIEMETGGVVTVDAGGNVETTAGGKVVLDATGDIEATTAATVRVVAGPIDINATSVDVYTSGDVKVDAQNIDLTGRTKFTWGAPNIELKAGQDLTLEAGRNIGIETRGAGAGNVVIKTTAGQRVQLQEAAAGETWIQSLKTEETYLTDAPSGMETLQKALPSLVTRGTRVLRSPSDGSAAGAIATIKSGDCETGESKRFVTAPHQWRRTKGALHQQDVDFIYVTSVSLSTSGNSITATSTKQQTRFRAYLHPWTGWSARVHALTGALSDNGTPGSHKGTLRGDQVVLCYK